LFFGDLKSPSLIPKHNEFFRIIDGVCHQKRDNYIGNKFSAELCLLYKLREEQQNMSVRFAIDYLYEYLPYNDYNTKFSNKYHQGKTK